MDTTIVNLTEEQRETLEDSLDAYDQAFIRFRLTGRISIGLMAGDTLVAGLDACMTAFKILYVSTVFVEERYRRQGYGRLLMAEMERRAKKMGANTVRLDTFSWQGEAFYKALGYEQVGRYANREDGYEEFFFMKRI